MKSIVLATVAALSLPAAALADGSLRPLPFAPPVAAVQLRVLPVHGAPSYAERREVAELRALVARLDAASPGRRDRAEIAWVQAALLRACEQEIADARVAQAASWHEVPGSRRGVAVAIRQPSSARLDALLAVRAGLWDVRGRTDRAALRQAADLGRELTRLAALDVRYDAPPPPPAWGRDHDDRGHDDCDLEHRRG